MNLTTDHNDFIISFDRNNRLFDSLIEYILTSKKCFKAHIHTADGYGNYWPHDLSTSDLRKDYTWPTAPSRHFVDIEDKGNRLVAFFDSDKRLNRIMVMTGSAVAKRDNSKGYALFSDLGIIITPNGSLAFHDRSLNKYYFVSFNIPIDHGREWLCTIEQYTTLSPYPRMIIDLNKFILDGLMRIVIDKGCHELNYDILTVGGVITEDILIELDKTIESQEWQIRYGQDSRRFEDRSRGFIKSYGDIFNQGLQKIKEL